MIMPEDKISDQRSHGYTNLQQCQTERTDAMFRIKYRREGDEGLWCNATCERSHEHKEEGVGSSIYMSRSIWQTKAKMIASFP